MFNRIDENLHYQSLIFEIGRSILVLTRHKCVSSSAAAMCCTGCPSDSDSMFIKSCCLKSEVLVYVWGFGLFFSFGYVLKLTTVSCATWTLCFQHTPVSFPCDSDLGCVFAAWLSHWAWPKCQHIPWSEVPAPGVPTMCRSSLVHSKRQSEVWQQ